MDTRNLYTDFNKLIDVLKTNYIYIPISPGTIPKWTHPKCLKYMDGYKYISKKPRNGAVIGINYNINWVKKLIKEWKDLALIKECICPDGSYRSNHRQDQAVLTILYYKYRDIYEFKEKNCKLDLTTHNALLRN